MAKGKSTKFTKCEICNKEISNNGYHRHIISCGRIKEIKEKRVGKNQYTKALELGLPKPVLSLESREKLSTASKKQTWSVERRLKLSNSMRQAVLNNPKSYTSNNVCGRVLIEDYKGEKFHGKWELEVAKWLDLNNIKWERKISPFNYYWNNNWHLYFPDFYLPDLDLYIEVKGYERDRDIAKWSVVSNLIVIKQKDIKLIKENKFALITH